MSQLQSVKVKLFEAADLATLETDVNTWLKGQATPAVLPTWQFVSGRFFYGQGAMPAYFYEILYTGS